MKKTAKLFFGGMCVFLGLAASAQLPGTFNTSFGSNGFETFNLLNKDQYGRAVAVQADGKVLIGGMHEHTAGKFDWLIYRTDANGQLDNTFSGDGKYAESFSDEDRLLGIAMQSTGKILITGYSEIGPGNWDIVVHRLNANGTLDNTFGNSGTVMLDRSFGAADAVTKIIVDQNDKIYLGGFMQILGDTYILVHRLLPNGDPDSTFSLDGDVFQNLNSQAQILDMALGTDGSVALCGGIDENGINKMLVAKITSNGLFDNSFAGDGIKIFTPGLNAEGALQGVTILPDNTVVAVGAKFGGNTDAIIVQLNSSGLLDGNFNGNGMMVYDLSIGGIDYFEKIELLANGKYIVLARTKLNNIHTGILYQLDEDGQIDNVNYGSGTGKLSLDFSAGSDFVAAMATNNNYVYTVGSFENGNDDDIFVTSSYLYNPVGIQEQPQTQSNVKIFPNPVSNSETLNVLLDEGMSGQVSLTLTSISGQILSKIEFIKTAALAEYKLDIQNCKRGMYLLHAENNGLSTTQKVIIQ